MRTLLFTLPLLALLACAESPKDERADGKTTPAEAVTYDTMSAETLRVGPPVPPDSAMEDARREE